MADEQSQMNGASVSDANVLEAQHREVGSRASRQWLSKDRIGAIAWMGAVVSAGVGVAIALATAPTTRNDFFAPGTQPNTLTRPLAIGCSGCHGYYDKNIEPYRPWAASMMGQSARDPIFHACLTIANQDAAFAGEMCLRCHVPQGWYRGGSNDPTGGGMEGADFQGVGCSVCHRAVDPIYTPGQSPAVDQSILSALAHPVVNPHNTTLVLDPEDRRRGPYELEITPHQWLQSPYHQSPRLCANCHEVSNPVYSKTPEGYRLNALDAPHPTGNKFDMFPIERTYSEWNNSTFASGPISLPHPDDAAMNRFGGNNPLVQTCQDCHMPRAEGTGCDPAFGTTPRVTHARHYFNGANTWVLRAVRSLFEDFETDLSEATVNDSIERTQGMLAAASDLELSQLGNQIAVRIVNQTGHKLPTGYPEGRRMWINVKFYDAGGSLVTEHGAYDPATAVLDKTSTKVYEGKLGMDAYAAALHNEPEGESFHFVLNNMWTKDNRIPPRGFTNAAFQAVQAGHVGYSYADGQHWDDTMFTVPAGAARAEVRVFHQLTTKEYIEFLRDENTTDNRGQVAYDQWVLHGKSTPTLMDFGQLFVTAAPPCSIDFNNDGLFPSDDDVIDFLSVFAGGACSTGNCNSIDFNGDGLFPSDEDVLSFFSVLAGGPC
jgi:hypothetical protein